MYDTMYFIQMQAVKNNQHEIIDFLLENGANPTLCDESGDSPLTLTSDNAVASKLEDAVKLEKWKSVDNSNGRPHELSIIG